ncbi:MAG: O-antigen ligase family protein [bacterium]
MAHETVRRSIIDSMLLFGIVIITLLQAPILRFMPILDPDIGIYMVLRSSWADDLIKILIFLLISIMLINRLLKNRDFFIWKADILLVIFYLVCLVSLFYSININYTLRALSTVCCYICFFYMVSRVFVEDSQNKEKIIQYFIVIALIVSVYGIFQRFFLFEYMQSSVPLSSLSVGKSMIRLRRVGSFFGWPNILGSFLGLAIPVTLGYFVSLESRRTRLFCIIGLFLMILCMVFTYSITGWISLSIGLLLEIILIWKYYGTNPHTKEKDTESDSRRSIKEKTFIIIMVTFILFISLYIIAQKRATSPLTNASVRARIGYLQGTFGIIKENLLWGTGLNTFRIAYLKHAPVGKLFETKYAHNTYLEMISEIGPLGLFFYCAFLLYVLVYGFKLLMCQENENSRYLTIGLLSGIIAYIFCEGGNYAMQIQKTNLYFWLILAILSGIILHAKTKSKMENNIIIIKGIYGKALIMMSILFIMLNLFLVKGQLLGDIYFYKGLTHLLASRSHNGEEELINALALLNKATQYNRYDHRYYCATSEAFLEMAKINRKGEEHIDSAIENYEKAIAYNPHAGPLYALLGDIYQRDKNDHRIALEYYNTALFYHPAYADIYNQKIKNVEIDER